MVGPRAEREAVRVARAEGKLSERRACGLIGMNRGSWRYQRKGRNEALRVRLREVAGERPRFGYRRLHRMLRREKWLVNHKRVYRLYREEGLSMRRRKGKRFRDCRTLKYRSSTLMGGNGVNQDSGQSPS